jgi:glycosyltransferase involved in cell wall biosynthesis
LAAEVAVPLKPAAKAYVASGSRRLVSPANQDDDHVTVSIAYYKCANTLRPAVESILNQTHPSLTLVVVNDGDEPPWNLLADINDPRLVCFDLQRNRGPYFAHAVALNATPDPYLLIQDADDWSEPHRLETLLHHIRTDGTAAAISALQYHDHKGQESTIYFTKFQARKRPSTARKMAGVSHHGLFRTDSLKAVGGYYAGFRIVYDSFLVNLLVLTGGVSFVNEPLYHYYYRKDSLMNAPKTRGRSKANRQVVRQLEQMYNQAYRAYKQYSARHIGYGLFCAKIRHICKRHLTPESKTALQIESNRLHELLTKASHP